MTNIIKNPRPTDVLQNSKHVLFVEGKDNQAFDPVVLSELFSEEINIEALGSSPSIRSVAPALYAYHPTYYFLIDRDFHFTDEDINKHWEKFPSRETDNLLIWRRKEIENYFLDPQYLAASEYCKVSPETLKEKILHLAEQRVNLDAANYILINVREKIKKTSIKKISKKGNNFPDKESALQQLIAELGKQPSAYNEIIENHLSVKNIKEKFYETLESLKGKTKTLKFESGNWLQMMEGKEILNQVIDSSYFKVYYKNKKLAHGKEKIMKIIKKLLRSNSPFQPEDFNILQDLINKKIRLNR